MGGVDLTELTLDDDDDDDDDDDNDNDTTTTAVIMMMLREMLTSSYPSALVVCIAATVRRFHSSRVTTIRSIVHPSSARDDDSCGGPNHGGVSWSIHCDHATSRLELSKSERPKHRHIPAPSIYQQHRGLDLHSDNSPHPAPPSAPLHPARRLTPHANKCPRRTTPPSLLHQGHDMAQAETPQRSMEARVGRDKQRYGPNGERLVAGVVALSGDRSKVLLIQSSARKGWVLPKGGWETDEATQAEAACREAWEEAGIECRVEHDLGEIEEKRSDAQIRKNPHAPRATYRFFEVRVKEEKDTWPEKHKRDRQWMSYAKARECLCDRPELLEALERSNVKRC
nr:diphosphoinositol polyphosphate phosphohydrolase aps1 [Quercus suber]